jgi:hypothetical protein
MGGGPLPVAAVAAAAPAPSNGSLMGSPPKPFDGDRTKAEQFMKEFAGYRIINRRNASIQNPMTRVALCLSYIKGKNVDQWAARQLDDLVDKVDIRNA